jgi:propionyl-CoA carboxylase alpha chain
MGRPITRLLIANRAEIARRILRSAHAMGISSVAVYSDGDAGAPFVREADQAVALGGRTSAETYLDIEKIIAAARRTGADAIHPGYGFLAENAAFARAVLDAGLVWVGPQPEAIAVMGDKISAKRLMEEAGVPTLPAKTLAHGDDLGRAAREIGFPLLVKASAGGGGKGMRVVAAAGELGDAVEAARREAAAAFGDDTVFLERWLKVARHVEVQLLGDLHGNLVHCFERECSIQRRHQKIVEEAPSPAVSAALRARIGEAALLAGRAIGYTSAGTVELLLAGEEFWFLEMNTRLQVEHPVTEEVTCLDLVREQLRIAEGEELGFAQEDLVLRGHAIEARLYAEDPKQGFLPATGRVLAWRPSGSTPARFDSGIETGSEVGIEFDPMLAKVIVHAPTRREAAARLARVLETTRIQGPVTNRDFLVSVLRSAEFLAGDTTTDFVERVVLAPRRVPTRRELEEAALFAAMAAQVDRRATARVLRTLPSGWRNTVMPPEVVSYSSNDETIEVEYRSLRNGGFRAHIDDGKHEVRVVSRAGDDLTLEIDGRRVTATVTADADRRLVHGPAGDVELTVLPRFPVERAGPAAGGLVAPMPGKAVSVHVVVGDRVVAGQLLVILEAMKMEHRLTAPEDGVVTDLRAVAGEQVANGELLVVVSPEGSPCEGGRREPTAATADDDGKR